MHSFQLYIKEIIDRVGAAALIVAATPCFVLAIAVIKMFSRGPLVFSQQRVGLNEQPFTIYKFRTMHVRASEDADTSVTVEGDARVFFGGRFLRKHKIDELPQLFNVLWGDMSLVGPRPTVIEDHQRMNERQRERSRMKPGITGPAQVNGGGSIPWPRRIEYELDYIENYSLWRDLKIVIKTAWLLATGSADGNPTTADEWTDYDTTKQQRWEQNATPEVPSRRMKDAA